MHPLCTRPPLYFNPRSREGSDHPQSCQLLSLLHFNPRSREGSDTNELKNDAIDLDFNPRSREGSDCSAEI